MFTGIIECVGKVVSKELKGTNVLFGIESSISAELQVDQSISHDGVCLTVTGIDQNTHFVTAIEETINKSNLGQYDVGSIVNLERAMLNNGRFDGHIVQGHVDCVGHCTHREENDGSWIFVFETNDEQNELVVEKGSICINGVSLTCFNVSENTFSVAIIPYTYMHTSFNRIEKTGSINIEFDVIGKYVKRMISSRDS